MNSNLTGKDILDGWATRWNTLVSQGLERFFGPGVRHALLGPLTWADLMAFACLIALVLVVYGLAVWFVRRRLHKAEKHPQARAWLTALWRTLGQPFYLLIWVYGVYLALTPILVKLGGPEEASPVRGFVDHVFGLGVFGAVVWLSFRLTRVLEAWLRAWSSGTPSRWDDLIAPLLGRTLRVIVPVVGLILGLPLIGLPSAFADVVAKASSVLVICAVAWVLFQGVGLIERAVLARFDITAADNLEARKIYTQVHVLSKTLYALIAIFTIASVLMLFDEVRRFGTSILASAGVIGIIIGFAAQKTIANLFAGFQLALTQPIRMDDVVIVEGEWGRIEEITLTYVVVKIWDERRLVVPLSYFIEKPFQNWTRVSANILGSVFVWTDFTVPLAEVRTVVQRLVEDSKNWDRRFWNLQVTDTTDRAMQLRILATAADASKSWDLRCEIREQLLLWLQAQHPESLPKSRAVLSGVPQLQRIQN